MRGGRIVRPQHWVHTVPLWVRSLFRRRQVDRELDEELLFHVERKTEDLVARGASATAAREIALRDLGGGLIRVKEQCRDTRRVRWIDTLLQDVGYGARVLRNSPGFTLVAAITLALGIGANSAMFSLVNGILLRSLPFPNPDRLVRVTGSYPQGGLVALRQQAKTMDLAAYAEGHDFNMTGWGEPVRLTGTLVSAELFQVLGTRAALGRTFLAGEDLAGRDRVVILSHALWQQRFGSDPSIVGRSIALDGEGRQIIGVMPADFGFPSTRTELWTPLHIDAQRVATYWAGDYMPVVGRLHAAASIPDASAEARLLQPGLRALFPWPMPADWNADVHVVALQRDMVGDVRTRLLLLLGAVALILGIACANVANLLLSRGATREGEIALRVALGAARLRIVRQLLTESLLLAFVGAALGVGLAASGLRVLKATLPADTPRLAEVSLDWRVLAFTAVLAIVAAAIFGLVPALHAARVTLTDSLKSGGRSASASKAQRMRSLLVVGEVALAAMLVVASGVLIRSFWTLSHVNPGFRTERVLTMRVSPNDTLCENAERCANFHRALLDRVRAVPDLRDPALINTLPLGGRVDKRSVSVQGVAMTRNETLPLFWLTVVSPDYFRVMNVTLQRGRPFNDADLSGMPPVAIVSAATARRFWPDEEAVGKRIKLAGQQEWHTIVGVVADVRAYDLQQDVPAWIRGTVYVPDGPKALLENGHLSAAMTLVLRTTLDERRAEEMVRQAVGRVNQETSVSEVRTMAAVVAQSVSTPRSTTGLFLAFAALAVALGMTGIYGVLSFFVSKRAREIGIRLALGAQRRDVFRLVVGEGAKHALLGIAIGLAGAAIVTRLMSSELYGVSPTDPLAFGSVAGLLFAVTLLACYVPARRAMRVDPLIALRSE
jgi:putative ABC transport system permease protein